MKEFRKRIPRGVVRSHKQQIGFKIKQEGSSAFQRIRKHGPGPNNLGLRMAPSGDHIDNMPTGSTLGHGQAKFIRQYVRNAKALLGAIVPPRMLAELEGELTAKAREAWHRRARMMVSPNPV